MASPVGFAHSRYSNQKRAISPQILFPFPPPYLPSPPTNHSSRKPNPQPHFITSSPRSLSSPAQGQPHRPDHPRLVDPTRSDSSVFVPRTPWTPGNPGTPPQNISVHVEVVDLLHGVSLGLLPRGLGGCEAGGRSGEMLRPRGSSYSNKNK